MLKQIKYDIADIAYFAGLLDGEGCVRIGRFKNSNGEIRYRAQIQIGMTDKSPIQWLKDTFGGGLYTDRKLNQPKSKPCYVWQVDAQDGKDILKQALPYLKVKYRQANNVIEFACTLTGPGGRGIAKPVPPKILQMRETLFNINKNLNAKGRVGDTLS